MSLALFELIEGQIMYGEITHLPTHGASVVMTKIKYSVKQLPKGLEYLDYGIRLLSVTKL